MKLVRFEKDKKLFYGILEGDRIELLQHNYFEGIVKTGEYAALDEVKLLAPCLPGKIVGCAFTYSRPGKPVDRSKNPLLFLKAPSALLNPGEEIILPQMSNKVIFENELVIVMGKKASSVSVEEAGSYIFGYTCGNDVSASDLLPPVGDWTLGKCFDTFMPLGPCIQTELDPRNAPLRSVVNGELKQDSNTGTIEYSINEIVSYISKAMTLFPEDIIITGTPVGADVIHPGDEISLTIEGIGTLINRVAK